MTERTKNSDLKENLVLKSIKMQYPMSEMTLACRSICQNLAFMSALYPCPVWMQSWLNGAKIGTSLTSPPVLKWALRHM